MRLVGVGTGRCGTMSLAALLDAQPGLAVSHELIYGKDRSGILLPWDTDWKAWERALQWVRMAEVNGDIGHFWLPYLDRMLDAGDGLQVVCLRRDIDDTVRSFLQGAGTKNQFSVALGPGERRTARSKCLPTYPLPLEPALRAYWREYHERVEQLQERHPDRVRIFDLEDLNSEPGQRAIFDFLDVSDPILNVGIRLNRSRRIPA